MSASSRPSRPMSATRKEQAAPWMPDLQPESVWAPSAAPPGHSIMMTTGAPSGSFAAEDVLLVQPKPLVSNTNDA